MLKEKLRTACVGEQAAVFTWKTPKVLLVNKEDGLISSAGKASVTLVRIANYN